MAGLNQIISSIYGYIKGTNLWRVGETNHLSAQYAPELLVSSAALQGTTYYPSAVGVAMAGFKDISYDIYLLGNAVGPTTITATVQATSDDVTPFWHEITRAGYLVTNPPAGGAASYASVGAVAWDGILDFDELNVKFVRITLVVSAANNCTARIYSRRKAL